LALELSAPRESYFGVAIEGMPVGRIARAYARRFGTPQPDPIVMTDAELGEWAKGHARDQQLSGEKARRVLGWIPKHLDPEYEISSIP
jgi:nucleoside-diphosphate-sugar epimerase